MNFLLPLLTLAASPFPAFITHDINPDAGTVPAITVVDIDGNGRLDIVAVSNDDVSWYENDSNEPSWKRHLITGPLKNLNVCIAANDLNADGRPELAIGADWQFDNTKSGGALYLLESGKDPRAPWKPTTLLEECPTLHRIRWADVDGDGPKELIVAPLKGINSTPPAHQETGVDLFLLRAPKEAGQPWERETINQALHVVHNVWPVQRAKQGEAILAASLEGLISFWKEDGGWRSQWFHGGNPAPLPDSGAGEIKQNARGALATIEPWHGTQVVVYTGKGAHWERRVLDDTYKGGHLVYWADFDKDGVDELLAGHREPSGPENTVGLYLYDLDAGGMTKHPVDVGGMATEDAVAADINGDGWVDIVAAGRATHNIRYYEAKPTP